MSRTALCILTAAGLAVASIGLMIVRYQVLGDEVKLPAGPGTWKVTMVVQGTSLGDAKLMTATPLDFGRQHVLREDCRSTELLDKPPDVRHPERRQVLWSQRGGVPNGPFRARYEFYCTIDTHRPTSSMSALARTLYEPPHAGEHLDVESRAGTDNERISTLARRLTAGHERPADQAEVLYRYVDEKIVNEPYVGSTGMSAPECLKNES